MNNKNNFSNRFIKYEYLILSFIVIIAFLLRLYKLNIPLSDHHSWRQADTAAVSRIFAHGAINLFYPQIDNMAPTHNPTTENPQRLYLVEFPLYNGLVAIFYKIWGIKESLARLTTIVISLLTLLVLYFTVKRYSGRKVAMFAILFFGVLPFNIFYSRVILPEPLMVLLSTLSIYLFSLYAEKKKLILFFGSLICFSLAILVKPYAIFFAPVLAYLFFAEFKNKKIILLLLFLFLSLLPFYLWRKYISSMPEGIPASGWLFNEENIRFSGAFFRWMIFERANKLILTTGGIILFSLGLILKPNNKEKNIYYVWFLSLFLNIFIFAKGNVTHDYYQIILIPILSIFMAKGANLLITEKQSGLFKPLVSHFLCFICLSLVMAFGYYETRGFYNLQMGIDLAGKAVGKLTPKNSLVITGDSADVSLLYNCARFGWAIGYGAAWPNSARTIEYLKSKSADYYVTTKLSEFDNNIDFAGYMKKNYPIVKRTNEYIIFDLNDNS